MSKWDSLFIRIIRFFKKRLILVMDWDTHLWSYALKKKSISFLLIKN